MSEYICKVHGKLNQDQYWVQKNGKNKSVANRCKLCRNKNKADNILGKKDCKTHGHLDISEIDSRGRCVKCHRINANKYRNSHRHEFNTKMAENRKSNPEKWDEIYKKQYEKFRTKYGHLYSLKKCCDARGITIEQYQKMDDNQKGKCAICFQPETRIDSRTKTTMRLTIDHCHKTKKVRGLLCHNCNTAIGKMFDDSIRMLRAIRYIKQGGFLS